MIGSCVAGGEEGNEQWNEEKQQNTLQEGSNTEQSTIILHKDGSTENTIEATNTVLIQQESIKRKKKKNTKKKNKVLITDDDFEPPVDFTKQEGFAYDPQKAEFDISEVRMEKRPWEIPDVRSIVYLRRLERKHNKVVHGLASVRKLTPRQIFKEEIREITKYNEDIRDEIQREHIRNGDWEYVDNEVHFAPDNVEELDVPLLNEGEPTVLLEETKEEE